MEFKYYISLEDSISASSAFNLSIRKKRVDVLHSVGYYSFDDIYSPEDFPPFNRSAVDGFAISSRETISSSRLNPSVFKVIGESSPENEFTGKIGPQEAVKIYTGGKLPDGADSVVMIEDSEIDSDKLKIFTPLRKFQNVSMKGEDITKDFKILKKGERITPPILVALLEVGIKEVDVLDFSISIISTGDEIVSGKVKNTTQPFLSEYFRWLGIDAVGKGSVRDDANEIKEAIESDNSDILILTGGTGPSDKDVVTEFLERNARKIFHGIRIRPARTTGLYIYRNKPVFVISGLPVASLIATENVILPIISKWIGFKLPPKIYEQGVLSRSVVNNLGFRSFVRVKMNRNEDPVRVIPIRVTGSGIIYSIIEANGILEIEENSEGFQEGDLVNIQLLRW